MDAIVWTDRYATRHPGMDHQHQVLFALLDQARIAVHHPQAKPGQQVVLDLLKYVIEHFSYEDNLMLASEYPHRAVHLAQHQHLQAGVVDLKDRFLAGTDATRALASFIAGWVQHHTLGEDRRLADHLETLAPSASGD